MTTMKITPMRVLAWVAGGVAALMALPAIYQVFANLVSPATYRWRDIAILVALVLVSGAIGVYGFLASVSHADDEELSRD